MEVLKVQIPLSYSPEDGTPSALDFILSAASSVHTTQQTPLLCVPGAWAAFLVSCRPALNSHQC